MTSEQSGVPITPEMWKEIEEEISQNYVHVVFGYKGYQVIVERVKESESKTCLQVYINGVIKGAWASEECTDKPEILNDVWKAKIIYAYSPAKRKEIIKSFGKRKAKKYFPNLESKAYYIVPHFSKASVLCRQYKKLSGIVLIKSQLIHKGSLL